MRRRWTKNLAGLTKPRIADGAGASHPSRLGSVARLGRHIRLSVFAPIAVVFAFDASPAEAAGSAGSAANVDAARITAADQDPANWMTYGRTYSEQRFSPLARDDGRQRQAARSCLVRRPRHQPRPGGDAAGDRRRAVRLDGMEHGQGVRRQDRRSCFGPTIPQCRARSASGAAATWSTVASPPGRARSSLPHSTADWSRSTRAPASRSGAS